MPPRTSDPHHDRPRHDRPRRVRWLAPALAAVALALLLGALVWHFLLRDTASMRRPTSDPPMLMLPPPPPPPPPEPEPQEPPEVEPQDSMPEPDPFDDVPQPSEEEAPVTDTADPVTMDADGQAGSDSFGIQRGRGGGMSGTGSGGAANASYGRYLGSILQRAIARDERVRRLSFQLQLDVWLEPDGRIGRAELVRGSGNREADDAVLEVIRGVRVETPPPASLTFPARVLVQGRRPAG